MTTKQHIARLEAELTSMGEPSMFNIAQQLRADELRAAIATLGAMSRTA